MRVLFIFGTRPEAIKLAPAILKMNESRRFTTRVCVTAQHRQMLDQVLGLFRITPHHDLNIMKRGQNLFDVTARGLAAVRGVLIKEKPDMVLVQGDTTTTLVGSLAAYYMRVPVGHVEAGLRTDDKYNPFPEEINRRLTTHIADLHFAPTPRARDNLLREGVPKRSIKVTGNTAVDALLFMREKISHRGKARYRKHFPFMDEERRMVLVTAHRRESFGEAFRNICEALREIVLKHPDVYLVYPVHMNPNVRNSVMGILRGIRNLYLIEPLEYELFVYLMMNAYLILTDSGGIQEEAPSLGKPVLVMRGVTERQEAVEAGVAKLVTTKKKSIVNAASKLLTDKEAYRAMVGKKNPYGNGNASQKIVDAVTEYLVLL